jgi:hypothetical protein
MQPLQVAILRGAEVVSINFRGALATTLALGGCAIMPDLPPDWALPMQEILLHSACELQWALRDIDKHPKKGGFDPRNWKIAVTLNPKIDADIQPGVGLTRKDPFSAGAQRFSTLVLGSGNGVTADMRGQRTGSVDFTFDSANLIADDGLPCNREAPSYHSLTKSLGIADWLHRSVIASRLSASKIDNPKFSAEVFIKFGGSGSYTYTMPPGTDLLSLSGYYQLDENLNINFTAKPKVAETFAVTTLPEVQDGLRPNRPRTPVQTTVTVFEDQQLSLQQIRQQLQNLRAVSQ